MHIKLNSVSVPASTRSSRHCLRSSDSNKLVVPPVKLSTYGRRSFTASGPIMWNSLPEYLRDPTLSIDTFRCYLKTYFFCSILIYTRRLSALETLWLHAVYKLLLWFSWLIFFIIARQHAMHAERDIVMANPSVCPSLSGIVSKRVHISSNSSRVW